MPEQNIGIGQLSWQRVVKDFDKELMLETSAYGCNNEALYHNNLF